jgi:hypothetical protein
MRARMGRIGVVAALAVVWFASTGNAQLRDTLQVGARVRVRVVATRGATNLFVGNLASVSPDTLVIDIPGGKGTIILPRSAISEVAVSQGDESRLTNVSRALPLAYGPVFLATTASSLHGRFRNRQYVLAALSTLPFLSFVARKPPERWEPMYHWLEGR